MSIEAHTYLIADTGNMGEECNTSFVREEAYKSRANPLFGLGRTELSLGENAKSLVPSLVVYEDKVFKMWYQIRGLKGGQDNEAMCKEALMAYAESEDGINFRPKILGQVEYCGNRKNNLLRFPEGQGKNPIRISGLFHDICDAEYPYKCVYNRLGDGKDFDRGILARHPEHGAKQWWYVWGIGKSRDGLVWEPPAHSHNLISANPEHARLHRTIDGGLVISDQMTSPIGNWSWRNVRGWITYDMETAHMLPDHVFSLPEHFSRHYAEFGSREWDRNIWIQPHVGLACIRKGNAVLALNGYLYGATGAETFAQTADIGLCISDTGTFFREVWPHIPFIRRGERGAWDFGMAAQVSIVDTETETRFYYVGGDVGNFSSVYLPGMAFIQRDRYGYRIIKGHRNQAKSPKEAFFSLKPIRLPAEPDIRMNVSNTDEKKYFKVELADGNGNKIEGFSFDECQPVCKDGLYVKVRWKGNEVKSLSGRVVIVRIKLFSQMCGEVYFDSPRIYAIYAGR